MDPKNAGCQPGISFCRGPPFSGAKCLNNVCKYSQHFCIYLLQFQWLLYWTTANLSQLYLYLSQLYWTTANLPWLHCCICHSCPKWPMKWPKRASVPVQQCMLSIEGAIKYAFKNTETVDVIPVSVDARLLVPHLLFTNGVYPWFNDVAFMVMFQWYNPTYAAVQPGILRRLNAAFQANNSWTYNFFTMRQAPRNTWHSQVVHIAGRCGMWIFSEGSWALQEWPWTVNPQFRFHWNLLNKKHPTFLAREPKAAQRRSVVDVRILLFQPCTNQCEATFSWSKVSRRTSRASGLCIFLEVYIYIYIYGDM